MIGGSERDLNEQPMDRTIATLHLDRGASEKAAKAGAVEAQIAACKHGGSGAQILEGSLQQRVDGVGKG
jgi:hypothetical protein